MSRFMANRPISVSIATPSFTCPAPIPETPGCSAMFVVSPQPPRNGRDWRQNPKNRNDAYVEYDRTYNAPTRLKYHGRLEPVNLPNVSSAKFPQPAKAQPACLEYPMLALPSGHLSKIKQSNSSSVGAEGEFFLGYPSAKR